MKVIRKILYALLFLIALLCAFIIICAFKPDIASKIGDLIDRDKELSAEADREENPIDDWESERTVYLPESADGDTRSDDADTDVKVESRGNDSPAVSSPTTGNSSREDTASAGLRSDNAADYIAPDESDITVPDNVSGRNGFRQIQGDAQQIDDTAIEDILSQLDLGHTGDGLDFDAFFYPYYAMLDDTGKHVYRQIYANANAVYPTFMPVEDVTSAQLRNIFEAVYNDHPELFWLETAYTCKYIRTGRCVEIDLQFNRTTKDLDSAKAAFNEQVNSIVEGAQPLSDYYSKEKYVHDQLIDRVSYSAGAEMNQSAYSALVNGKTVCAGYARAFQYILQQLRIPCYYCTGYAGESHAWNIVGLGNDFYNVDTTWDDSGSGQYDYFNKTDEDYSSSHLRQDLSVYLPPCNGQIYRNLEQSQESGDDSSQANLRSLADVGMTEDQVFKDINSYYNNCYNQMIQNGIGHYTFYNVVADEELAQEIMWNYRLGDYLDAYMQRAIDDMGAAYCTWMAEAEELQGGMYLISHEIRATM